MSVLYKALQKAEKENELRQSATSETGFDPQRLAASGALKFAGGRGQTMNRFVMGGIGLLAVALGVTFVVLQDDVLAPIPPAQTALPMIDQNAAPPATAVAATAPEAAPAGPVATPADAASAETQVAVAGPSAAPATAPPATAESAPVAEGPAEPGAEKQVAAVPPVAAKPAARPAAQRPEPVPAIPADSPARMLSPPISINRAEFELIGVGNQVQVRQVADSARSNASAGYDALVRGSYDTALGFYEAVLKEEPNSVLAMLGRATALQKLGRGQEAQTAYDQVLKLDPSNREALTNLTSIVAERSPQDAITRLLELERAYPSFSPVKAQLGLTYAKTGSMQQALDYLGRAVALAPETMMYQYNLALVLDHLGRKEQAIASYERVLASIVGGRAPAELSVPEIERRVQFLRAR